MKRNFGIFIGSILFGLAVGFVMYLPTPEVVINGGAVNLTVMTSLWLGAMVSVQTPVKEAILEVIVAVVCFCFVAAAMQGFEYFLVLGFMVQGHWALIHANGQRGVKVHSWFPILAVGANVGMAIAPLYHFWSSL